MHLWLRERFSRWKGVAIATGEALLSNQALVLGLDAASVVLVFDLGHPPAQLEVEPEVPHRHCQGNGQQFSQVGPALAEDRLNMHVHAPGYIQHQPSQADHVELEVIASPEPDHPCWLQADQIRKGPGVVPDESYS
jgi:hypothetical protein